MNRFLSVACATLACALALVAWIPQPAAAEFSPDPETDFIIDVDKVIYTDQAGRIIVDDFSVQPFPGEQIAYFDVSQYANGHEGVYDYNIQADKEFTPAAYLNRIMNDDDDEHFLRLALDQEEGDFGWFPLVMGDGTARNIDLSVKFTNFRNVTESQTGYHFQLAAGGCTLTGLWFTGTRANGKTYRDALIFFGAITDDDGTTYPVSDTDGYPLEAIITDTSDPDQTTVTLRLIISTYNEDDSAYQGGLLSASYKINDEDTVAFFEGSTLNVRQVTGYDGTYTDDQGVEHSYDQGDSVGYYSFPFIHMYTKHYAAGSRSNTTTVIDEHVGGTCFIDNVFAKPGKESKIINPTWLWKSRP
ncbi:hypothetical protein Dalk_4254 [Desulfatibacillum aliphaticivorans]|uniref:Uncharacterized protein n=1 Tax=Desulfatibacillum aliphaticivorans TaxID=218208 RepID=B8FM97_DESAL|nr:hypothetical protein [Desulfatibacillum aliphaticivorans]ACL05935.1 hypothetical protein Dalk_4254 [Desulfatibacillum aliphaticivorans]